MKPNEVDSPAASSPESIAGGEASIRVCVGTGGVAAGALDVLEEFRSRILQLGLRTSAEGRPCRPKATGAGCHGFCRKDVLVDVVLDGTTYTYERVQPKHVARILEEHVVEGRPVREWLAGEEYRRFHDSQERVLLEECSVVDPEDIESYEALGGYRAARRAFGSMTPEKVLAEVEKSGLRGRGGGGFPTGLKWRLAREAEGNGKCLICNADEGDPGAFMDRSLLEGTPHAVIEGMLLGARAIGATEGIVYVRAEYPLANERLRIALYHARRKRYLGRNVFGSGQSFDIEVKQGAGAFVCGEETALIASLEDRIGTPRQKPPFPVNEGLWGRPTVINNVETWATIPKIVRHGADWFSRIGTEQSPGTKIFSLVGKIRNTGLVEVPMGMPLRDIVYDIGGGCLDRKRLKAVQTGGPSGGCIPAHLIDTPVDYESLTALGSIMGSGGMVVMDEDTCMVDVARFFLSFCREESCGQCTPCRDGTAQMVRLLEEICAGEGTPNHLDMLEELSTALTAGSLCGLGKTAANPVISTLKFFREEYEAHIHEKRCPAGVCKALITYRINESCSGCTLCRTSCPYDAITGVKHEIHSIDPELCTRCGICYDVCSFRSIDRE